MSADLIAITGLCLAFLALALLGRAFFAKRSEPPSSKAAKNAIVVDGSNVMHWGGAPSLKVLRRVIEATKAKGFTPIVIFDANAGYKLDRGYLGYRQMAGLLELPHTHVIVVPKGEPADETILRFAKKRGVRIVTNDRFRDWSVEFPLVKEKKRLVKGEWRQGSVMLRGL